MLYGREFSFAKKKKKETIWERKKKRRQEVCGCSGDVRVAEGSLGVPTWS